MATIESNGSIVVIKYNNIVGIDISIRDPNDDEVLLLDNDVKFLSKTIRKWLLEDIEDDTTKS